MSITLFIAVAILVLLSILLVALTLKKKQSPAEPSSAEQAAQPLPKKTRWLVWLIGIAVVALSVVIIIIQIADDPEAAQDVGSSVVIFAPIWAAIFIPAFASRTKRESLRTNNKVLLGITIAGLVLLAIGIIAFFMVNK